MLRIEIARCVKIRLHSYIQKTGLYVKKKQYIAFFILSKLYVGIISKI